MLKSIGSLSVWLNVFGRHFPLQPACEMLIRNEDLTHVILSISLEADLQQTKMFLLSTLLHFVTKVRPRSCESIP